MPNNLQMFIRPSREKEVRCPLCCDPVQQMDNKPADGQEDFEPIIIRNPVVVPRSKIQKHIARHFERLSLFAIPPSYEINEDATSLHTDRVNFESESSSSGSTLSEEGTSLGNCRAMNVFKKI
jgi:hypothetical protein